MMLQLSRIKMLGPMALLTIFPGLPGGAHALGERYDRQDYVERSAYLTSFSRRDPLDRVERRLDRMLSFVSDVERAEDELEGLLADYRRNPGKPMERRLQGILRRRSAGVLTGLEAFREGKWSIGGSIDLLQDDLARARNGLRDRLSVLERRLRREERTRSSARRALRHLRSLMDTPLARKYLAEKYSRNISRYRSAGRRIDDCAAGLAESRSDLRKIENWERIGDRLNERIKKFSAFLDREREMLKKLGALRDESAEIEGRMGEALLERVGLIGRLAAGLEHFRGVLERFSQVSGEIDRAIAEKNVFARDLDNGAAILNESAGSYRSEESLDRSIERYAR